MITPKEIAHWMFEELKHKKYLYQEKIVHEIASKFGSEFTYINEDGNLAIDKRVLRDFRILMGERLVWERSDRFW